MRFLDLYISGFGKFHDTAVSFEDGLNVIYGKNEAGKSTIHTFIRGMLFGIERQRGAPPETTSTANMSHGKTAAPTRGSSGLNPTTAPLPIERSFQKIRRNYRHQRDDRTRGTGRPCRFAGNFGRHE